MTGTNLPPNPATGPDGPIHPALDSATLGLLNTTAGQLIVLVACWMGIGLIAAFMLRKRGHEFRSHAALGAVLGPAFVFLAYDTMRRRESEQPIMISSSADSTGPSVLVVAAGVVADREAVQATIRSLGEVGGVYAAVPVEYEVADRVHAMGDSPPDSSELEELAEALAEFSPGLMMLPGLVEKSIPGGVAETGSELVVLVGSDSASVAPGLEETLTATVIRVETS